MTGRCCCEAVVLSAIGTTGHARVANGDPRPQKLARWGMGIARWLVPSGILALLPKCPACFAAYLAIGTGVGVSMSTATYLRAGLVMLCVVSLTYLIAKRGRHFIMRMAKS